MTAAGTIGAMALRKLHRMIRCWRITRRDGAVLRFTEASATIDVQGEVFDPAQGMSTSATQAKAGLDEQNFEAFGVISDDRIKHTDLRAGLYSGAQIDVLLVDWRYPELGSHRSETYWIERVSFEGTQWRAEITGLTGWMRRNEGDVYSRTCRYDLGDDGCKVDVPGGFTQSPRSVSVIVESRIEFSSTVSGESDGYFSFGDLLWISGANAGLKSEVAQYTEIAGIVRLRLETPFDIAVSDTFRISAGCNKQRSTCVTKFANLVNNGGFPFIPGMDKILEISGGK